MKDRLIDWGERLFLLTVYVLFVAANFHGRDLVNWLVIGVETLTAFLVLTRRQAISVSEHPIDWAFALAGTFLPMLLRPGGAPTLWFLSVTLASSGMLFSLFAKLSLNRRFGVTPANRGVQSAWAYSVIRHPMYLGYFLSQAGYLLHNPTLRNLMLVAIAWSVQLVRISREENHLMLDEAYRAYAARVRRRLIPGVY